MLSGGRTLCAGGQQQWHGCTRSSVALRDTMPCRWHGIALEPVNSTFQRLQNNYAPFPRVQPVLAALSNRAGAHEMVTGIGWSGEAARFVWNAREQKWRAGRRPKERVSTVTLEDVWAMPPVAGARHLGSISSLCGRRG